MIEPLGKSAAALALVAALAVAGCGGDDEDDGASTAAGDTTAAESAAAAESEALPPRFAGPALADQDRSAEGMRVVAGVLESGAGQTAEISFEDGGPPQNWTGTGECDGTSFDQAAVVDEPHDGTLEIAGVGSARLAVERTVTVIAGAPPPPCEERTGSWSGASGELEGRTGTFSVVTTQGASVAESTLTLREE